VSHCTPFVVVVVVVVAAAAAATVLRPIAMISAK